MQAEMINMKQNEELKAAPKINEKSKKLIEKKQIINNQSE